MRIRSFRLLWMAVTLVGVGAVSGCTQNTTPRTPAATGIQPVLGSPTPAPPPPPPIDPTQVPERDDIFAVYYFWPSDPWLRRGEQVVGFRVPTYFVSGETNKGAFVPGAIIVYLHGFVPDRLNRPTRELFYKWQFNREEAMNYRVRKEAITGYYYGLLLTWPEELDLGGRQVEVQIAYRRLDGTEVRGSPRRVQVPATQLPVEPPLRTAPARPAPGGGEGVPPTLRRRLQPAGTSPQRPPGG